jgi:hypothetical protein
MLSPAAFLFSRRRSVTVHDLLQQVLITSVRVSLGTEAVVSAITDDMRQGECHYRVQTLDGLRELQCVYPIDQEQADEKSRPRE